MTITTIGTFPNKMIAEKVIRELRASGVADTEIYQNNLQSGTIVVITRTDITGVKDIFESYDAGEIREYIETIRP